MAGKEVIVGCRNEQLILSSFACEGEIENAFPVQVQTGAICERLYDMHYIATLSIATLCSLLHIIKYIENSCAGRVILRFDVHPRNLAITITYGTETKAVVC